MSSRDSLLRFLWLVATMIAERTDKEAVVRSRQRRRAKQLAYFLQVALHLSLRSGTSPNLHQSKRCNKTI